MKKIVKIHHVGDEYKAGLKFSSISVTAWADFYSLILQEYKSEKINMHSETLKKLNWRYATKRFDSSKILSPQKLDILKEAFNLTATSYGLQPVKLVIVSDQNLKDRLMPLTYNQPQVRDASHVLVLCVEIEINEDFIIEHFKRVEDIRKTSREILQKFEDNLVRTFSDKEKTEIKEWMINQLYLSLGALLTVCAMENIDSCPMEGFQPDEYDRLLGLDKMGLQSVIVLPVGYRDESDFFLSLKKVRRGVEELVIEL